MIAGIILGFCAALLALMCWAYLRDGKHQGYIYDGTAEGWYPGKKYPKSVPFGRH